MNNKSTKFALTLATIFLFAFQALAKKNGAVISVDGSVYATGMYPKELYEKLGFKAGPSKEQFEKYRQDIETSELSFEMMPVVGGTFKMGSAEDDENRGDEELLE
ncbi:MAG: formylglycine-generating enzyme family protein, partial [Verrucomicrobiota bacterium]|nr:formylglycine-generating enzyme family protein [Verrucomicrobiota bacterium]